jgi:hypothetical protein
LSHHFPNSAVKQSRISLLGSPFYSILRKSFNKNPLFHFFTLIQELSFPFQITNNFLRHNNVVKHVGSHTWRLSDPLILWGDSLLNLIILHLISFLEAFLYLSHIASFLQTK